MTSRDSDDDLGLVEYLARLQAELDRLPTDGDRTFGVESVTVELDVDHERGHDPTFWLRESGSGEDAVLGRRRQRLSVRLSRRPEPTVVAERAGQSTLGVLPPVADGGLS